MKREAEPNGPVFLGALLAGAGALLALGLLLRVLFSAKRYFTRPASGRTVIGFFHPYW